MRRLKQQFMSICFLGDVTIWNPGCAQVVKNKTDVSLNLQSFNQAFQQKHGFAKNVHILCVSLVLKRIRKTYQ